MNRNDATVPVGSNVRTNEDRCENEVSQVRTVMNGSKWVRTLSDAAPAGVSLLQIVTALYHAPLPSEYYELVGEDYEEVA